eukprot:1422815-Alexandrium_andersonii.AAC.1
MRGATHEQAPDHLTCDAHAPQCDLMCGATLLAKQDGDLHRPANVTASRTVTRATRATESPRPTI